MSHEIMECPHCLNEVKRGANICASCKAEIRYGAPPIIRSICFVAVLVAVYYMFVGALRFGISLGAFDPNIGEGHNGLAVLGIMVVVSIILYYIVRATIVRRIYKNRVVFRRNVQN